VQAAKRRLGKPLHFDHENCEREQRDRVDAHVMHVDVKEKRSHGTYVAAFNVRQGEVGRLRGVYKLGHISFV